MSYRAMNEHEANAERVAALGTSLNDAMLDAINALPPEERALMCDKVRDAITNAPIFRIVDDETGRAA
jgi:hypothetical protein